MARKRKKTVYIQPYYKKVKGKRVRVRGHNKTVLKNFGALPIPEREWKSQIKNRIKELEEVDLRSDEKEEELQKAIRKREAKLTAPEQPTKEERIEKQEKRREEGLKRTDNFLNFLDNQLNVAIADIERIDIEKAKDAQARREAKQAPREAKKAKELEKRREEAIEEIKELTKLTPAMKRKATIKRKKDKAEREQQRKEEEKEREKKFGKTTIKRKKGEVVQVRQTLGRGEETPQKIYVSGRGFDTVKEANEARIVPVLDKEGNPKKDAFTGGFQVTVLSGKEYKQHRKKLKEIAKRKNLKEKQLEKAHQEIVEKVQEEQKKKGSTY